MMVEKKPEVSVDPPSKNSKNSFFSISNLKSKVSNLTSNIEKIFEKAPEPGDIAFSKYEQQLAEEYAEFNEFKQYLYIL